MSAARAGKSKALTYLGATFSILVALVLINYFKSPLGYFAVRKACAEDGGLRIHSKAVAEGYWHAGADWFVNLQLKNCDECADQVARRKFSYINFEKPATRQDGPHFVQYRLEPATSPNCILGAYFSKPPEGTCVAVVPLENAPSDKYKYRREILTARGLLGASMREIRRTLVDVPTNQTIAIERYFDHATPWERNGKFEASYHCDRSMRDGRDDGGFFAAVFATTSGTEPIE